MKDSSGTTSGTPGTATTAIAANTSRIGYMVQNVGASDIWINEMGTATAASGSIKLTANATYISPANATTANSVSVISAGTSIPFTAREW